ncbi:Oidioi.mRNA.OKI2018_I69.XSR.g15972.t1.cds [Oikopleura dioica]|uniref:Transmembrane protein 196 n=1 Tax=Oikopleura dioica TaxID=34765 RepID=A0ABN7SIH9_OIKDI|nr:Oidioi.mRNA.OKI2018_I69.XSR.g15972.t1.cds [Oikopleura dioica]
MAQSGGQFRNEEFRVRSRPNRAGNGDRQIPNRPQFLPDRVPDLTKDIADVVCGLDTDGVLIGLAGIKSLLVVPLLVLGVVIISQDQSIEDGSGMSSTADSSSEPSSNLRSYVVSFISGLTMAVSAAVDFILFRQRDSSRILAYTSSSAFTFVADIICIDYVRTVITSAKDDTQKPLYITCMTITILGAVLAVVSMYVGARMAALEEKRLMTERGGRLAVLKKKREIIAMKKLSRLMQDQRFGDHVGQDPEGLPVSLHGEDDGQDREGNHFQGKCQDSICAFTSLMTCSYIQDCKKRFLSRHRSLEWS